MNLWVKRTGQLLVAVLFLVSCEDDTYLLGFKNKNQKFNVRRQEFTLPSTVILVDSLITDNLDNTSRLLVGQYQDFRFGTVRAEAFTQLFPANKSRISSSSVFDSVTIKVRLDFYSYGLEGESLERMTVHEITEDSISPYRHYFYNSTLGYNPSPLGEISCLVNTDTLSKHAGLGAKADTILYTGRLAHNFGLKLFSQAFVDTDSTFSYQEFAYFMKGLAFVPSQSNMIVGINTNSVSEVTIHYHTPEDTLTRSYRIGPAAPSFAYGFNNITTTRTGDLAAITQTYEGYAPPSGWRYLQSGSPAITKVDISEFYSFITGSSDGINDSITNMEINSAEISFNIETPPDGMAPPTQLFLRVMNSDDLYLNNAVSADNEFMSGFYAFTGDITGLNKRFGAYYYPGNDTSRDWITVDYNSSSKKYTGYATLFFHNLFAKKEGDRKKGIEDPNQIQYLGIVPISPTPSRTVNRAVINASSIKLKVTYTSPKVTNQ